MTESYKEIIWLLLLIPFGIVLGTGLFFIFSSSRRANRVLSFAKVPQRFRLTASPSTLMETPRQWLAVRSHDPYSIQQALGLNQPTPCSWEEGVNRTAQDQLFISPCVSGWVLVIGAGLPSPFDDIDRCHRFLADLSRKLGHVQFFSANRSVNQHAWAMLERGTVFRGYAWDAGTLWNQGPRTAAEKELALCCLDYGCDEDLFALRDEFAANTEKVGLLAGRWSLNPAALNPHPRFAIGIAGEISRSQRT